MENASYGGAICAERTAFVTAVASGYQEFIAIGVVTDMDSCVSPCGYCRQFMAFYANLGGVWERSDCGSIRIFWKVHRAQVKRLVAILF